MDTWGPPMKILGTTNQFQGISEKSLQHNGASNHKLNFSYLIKTRLQRATGYWKKASNLKKKKKRKERKKLFEGKNSGKNYNA